MPFCIKLAQGLFPESQPWAICHPGDNREKRKSRIEGMLTATTAKYKIRRKTCKRQTQ